MEEDQYRATYQQLNPVRCAFEKSILARKASCPASHKFCLAEREGVSCQHPESQKICVEFLEKAREKSLFALKITNSEDKLPHAKEVRIQLGSLAGLQEIVAEEPAEPAENIEKLLNDIRLSYPQWHQLPFEILVRHISHTETRPRRGNRTRTD